MIGNSLSLGLSLILSLTGLSLAPSPDDSIGESRPVPAEQRAAEQPGSAADLLKALADNDRTINTLNGEVRFTTIQALEGDIQTRHGWLFLRTDHVNAHRDYAVRFDELIVDQRKQDIDEQYCFDGQWLVEKLPADKQFNKTQLVPAGEQLDPMELMREAPFWVSLGHDTSRVLGAYKTELLDTNDGLTNNEDFPELAGLAVLVEGCTQLMLTPRPGSGLEDDWDHVRIWVDASTLLPRLYIKAEWTGNIQIVELFGVEPNTPIKGEVFSTQTPDDTSGWNIQISPWRGKAKVHEPTNEELNEMEQGE